VSTTKPFQAFAFLRHPYQRSMLYPLSDKLFIQRATPVGIGTTTPAAKLTSSAAASAPTVA
jgi:hypothetical protein